MTTGRVFAGRVGLVALVVVLFGAGEPLAGSKLYEGSWIAESFGNDKVGIGTQASAYFEVDAIPAGVNCHGNAPLCDFSSTPVTTAGPGTAWAPLGPGCRPLTAGELPRPAKGGTLTPLPERTLDDMLRGRDVIVTTGTASGKSLAYALPILDAIARRPRSRWL